MELVQVDKAQLLEYIAHTEYLIKDHNKQQQQITDLKDCIAITETTYKTKLENLMDLILDQNSTAQAQYTQGLIDAYNLIKQGVLNG